MARAQRRKVPERTIGRLTLYRRLLERLLDAGVKNVFSHQIAGVAGCTAAQVRRDLMTIGYSAANPKRGYDVARLIAALSRFLGADRRMGVALVGVGNLGRAIMGFFRRRSGRLALVAAFDKDPQRVGRTIHGCRCHPMEDLTAVVDREGISVGIITVPASAAQEVADHLVAAGVSGLLNFAPVPLRVPPGVYVEDVDLSRSLERVAFFVRHGRSRRS